MVPNVRYRARRSLVHPTLVGPWHYGGFERIAGQIQLPVTVIHPRAQKTIVRHVLPAPSENENQRTFGPVAVKNIVKPPQRKGAMPRDHATQLGGIVVSVGAR